MVLIRIFLASWFLANLPTVFIYPWNSNFLWSHTDQDNSSSFTIIEGTRGESAKSDEPSLNSIVLVLFDS